MKVMSDTSINEGLKLILREYKNKKGCIKCKKKGELTLHHRKKEKDNINIGTLLLDEKTTLLRFLKEVAKCDVMCRKCHLLLHRTSEVTNLEDEIRKALPYPDEEPPQSKNNETVNMKFPVMVSVDYSPLSGTSTIKVFPMSFPKEYRRNKE